MRNVSQPNPIAKMLSVASTTSPMVMIRSTRPVPTVGPKNLVFLREFGPVDIGAYGTSGTCTLRNHTVTPFLSLKLHDKKECILVPAQISSHENSET